MGWCCRTLGKIDLAGSHVKDAEPTSTRTGVVDDCESKTASLMHSTCGINQSELRANVRCHNPQSFGPSDNRC